MNQCCLMMAQQCDLTLLRPKWLQNSVKLESCICLTENMFIFTDKCIVADNERLCGLTRDIIDCDFATSHNTKGLTYVADARADQAVEFLVENFSCASLYFAS